MYNSYVRPFLKKIKQSLGYEEDNKLSIMSPCFYYYDKSVKNDLLIFDDFLPNLLGSWRAVEIGTYLKKFNKAQLVCFLSFYNDHSKYIQFERDKKLFFEKFGISKQRSIVTLNYAKPINTNAKLAYCLFYHNIRSIYPILQTYQIPFLFTLFPGGGFAFYNKEGDSFLKILSASPLLKKVIITQQSNYDYLIDRKIFKKNQLSLMYGACFPVENYKLNKLKEYYGKNKMTLDICFVAAKYMDNGLDKGFDIFCHVAYKLCEKYDFVQFHVVGNYTSADLMFEIPDEKIHFYGLQSFNWFPDFYYNKDIILSPVRSFVLRPGAFDGFPTGAVIDAGLYEVLMMTSDPLGDNSLPKFLNWHEIIITEIETLTIIQHIEKIIKQPDLIESIGKAGRKKILSIFSEQDKLNNRIKLIESYIND